ncbi:MAG TPA: calcium/proton exchanger [Demequinaceae bacterium]
MTDRKVAETGEARPRETASTPGDPARPRRLGPRDVQLLSACAILTVASGTLAKADAGPLMPFIVSAVALALLASLVGRSVDALGDRLGAGATGVVQSALGNLPELFVCIFALKAGLYDVVRAAIVGSILSNVLLVLGLAFVFGGLRHGRQRFSTDRSRTLALMLLLAVFALAIPSLTFALHTPAALHEEALSQVTAIVLIALFALSLPAALAKGAIEETRREKHAAAEAASVDRWPLWLALGVLAAAAVAAAFVSDWFVTALTPAMESAHISATFAGLVIVAIAGNAVENVVGIQLALRNKADYALAVILQSPLQVALVVAPALVLAAPLIGANFTLVLSPLLLAALLVSVIVTFVVVFDGESTWFEGAALVSLYVLLAAGVWWG